MNPPSQTIRGMFVLACSVAGIAGGAIAIFFWKAARYCIGAWGGLAFGWWIQCFRNGGLISSVGLRWILYIGLLFLSLAASRLTDETGCAVIGFVLSTIPKVRFITRRNRSIVSLTLSLYLDPLPYITYFHGFRGCFRFNARR